MCVLIHNWRVPGALPREGGILTEETGHQLGVGKKLELEPGASLPPAEGAVFWAQRLRKEKRGPELEEGRESTLLILLKKCFPPKHSCACPSRL